MEQWLTVELFVVLPQNSHITEKAWELSKEFLKIIWVEKEQKGLNAVTLSL